MPVWQAVRPWGRSLSVHQGKGLDPVSARLGACMEAIECADAEAWKSPTTVAALADLPASETAPAADDFATRRGALTAETRLDWAPAERLDGGGTLWVPAAAVSLDLAAPGLPAINRSSNGQGAGFDVEHATLKGLCEMIERDAFAAWGAQSLFARAEDAIDLDGIDFPWLIALRTRLGQLGIGLRAFALPGVVAMPVIAAELFDPSSEAIGFAHSAGTCAHPCPEAALRGAVTEAIQARLTVIAGARDDLNPLPPEAPQPVFGFAITLPGARPQRCLPPALSPTVAAGVAALAAAGYPQAARVVLSPPQSPVVTVKVLVPGLGESARCRRPPA